MSYTLKDRDVDKEISQSEIKETVEKIFKQFLESI